MNLISTTSHINENPSSYSIFIISMKSNEIQSPYSKPAGQNPITPPESLSPFVINDQKEDKMEDLIILRRVKRRRRIERRNR
jgi:hypothetical protein